MTKKRRILWVSPYFSWPASNGGKTRQNALLRALAGRGHEITLLALAKEMPSAEAIADAERVLARVLIEPRRKRTSLATLARGLCSLRPVVATVNGCSATFSARFEKLLQEHFDNIQIEHSYTFEPLRGPLERFGRSFILTEHNIESNVVKLQYDRLPRPLRMLAGIDIVRSRLWEKTVISRAACVVAVSAEEEIHFQNIGARATALVANCIDTSAHRDVKPQPASAKVLFVGNYDYSPNVAAVQWLCDAIMPRVWSMYPTATLAICGYAMPSKWRERWKDPRIGFLGYVPNIIDVHAASSIFVAPLRAGAGSKLKVIEAMASGLPVVATAQGVSGLGVMDGVHYRHGQDATELATAILDLLRDPAAAGRLGHAARAYAVRNHDWTGAADALEAVYAEHG